MESAAFCTAEHVPEVIPACANGKSVSLFDDLNGQYLAMHVAKEDAFWAQKMGLRAYVEGTFEKAEITLRDWTSDGMTTVSVSCDTNTTHVYVNNGIYKDFPMGVPVVTVTASVPYTKLFATLGIRTASINLNATQQAAVIGV